MNSTSAATIVYRTRGKVYHSNPRCGMVGRNSVSASWAVELGGEFAKGLKPCSKCGEAAAA
jgi:hypothetical protein